MHLVLVFSISALMAKSYVADGTIKIIIKFFILALKNVTSASELKKKKKLNLIILIKKIKNRIKNQKLY